MSDSLTATMRGIVLEDLMTSSTLATTVAPVLNVGPSVTVTPIVVAASDAAAAAAGLPVGGVYLKTVVAGASYLAARLV